MPRKPRLHLPGGLYHVILRGNDRQDIFFEEEDRLAFYRLLEEGTRRFDYRVHAFCLMTNHVGQIVRVFKSITAREIFRRKPSVKRALWGGEFWTDGYYVATVGEGGSWEVIERYVRNQGKPKDELRQLKLF